MVTQVKHYFKNCVDFRRSEVRHTDSVFSTSFIPVFLVLESLSLSHIFEMEIKYFVVFYLFIYLLFLVFLNTPGKP